MGGLYLYMYMSPKMGFKYTGHAFLGCSQDVVEHCASSDDHHDKSEEITDQ